MGHYFNEKQDLYLVMEMIEGKTIGDMIELLKNKEIWVKKEELKIIIAERLQILFKFFSGALDCLEKLQEVRGVHWDLNPGNFMLDFFSHENL